MITKVIDIAKRGADLMRYENIAIEEKTGAENIVTSADLAVQKFLEKELLALLPDSDFYGEEDGKQNTGREYRWIVDPIDGTTNFARRLGDAAVSIALMQNGEIILGVVYNPFKDELFWAEKGKGAFLGDKPIHVSDTNFEHSIVCSALCQYYKDYSELCSHIFMELFYATNDFRRFGSCALELCYLAAGRADVYFELRVFPWDHAAASFILREAGGVAGTFQTEVFDYTISAPVMAANNRENFEKLNAIIEKHMKKVPYHD